MDGSIPTWKGPVRPRFDSHKSKTTALDLCKSLLIKIERSLQSLKKENFDVTAFMDVVVLSDFFLQKITQVKAGPQGNVVEENGEALLFLANILTKYKKLASRLGARPKYSLSSRTRRYLLTFQNILLRQEARGAGEKNEAAWSSQEKKEAQSAALEEIPFADARNLWSKILCSDLGYVPWDHFFKLFEKAVQLSISPNDEAILKKLMTKTGVEYIRPSEFTNFLKAFDFGNLSPSCVSNAKQMWFSSGFYPWCSEHDAVKYLSGEPDGSYILSLSARTRSYYELSVVTGSEIQTWWIRCENPNGVYVTNSKKPDEEAYHKTLATFMHQCNATLPHHSEFLSEEGFLGDLTTEEIGELLISFPDGTYIISYDAEFDYPLVSEDESKPFFTVSYLLKSKIQNFYISKSTHGYRLQQGKKGSKRVAGLPFFESFRSVIHSRRDVLKYNWDFDNVPYLSILPFTNTGVVTELLGPEKEKEGVLLCYKTHLCAESVGGYPAGSQGSIMCDRFHVKSFGDRTIFALADGCNWGVRPRTAATRASAGFIDYLADLKIQSEASTLLSLKEHILRAYRVAHAKIVGDIAPEEIWTISQTTLIGGMIVPLVNNKTYKWAALFFSVGDCKAFLFNETDGVKDLTYGNRVNARNAKDTGGRLGPYVDGGQPDLRNLKSYFWPLKTGDIFFVVSDGVYDNMDPETLGYTPMQMKLSYPTWDDVPPLDVISLKNAFTVQYMNNVLFRCKQRTPYFLTRALLQHGMNITSKSRGFMEANPNSPEPADHTNFPGKMDHITAIGLRAGCLLEEKLTNKEKKNRDKEIKERAVLLKKQAKDHPDELMYLTKKNLRSGTIQKYGILKTKQSRPDLLQDTFNYPAFSLRYSTTMGLMVKSPPLNVAGLSITTVPDDTEPVSEPWTFEYTASVTKASVFCLGPATHYGSLDPASKVVDCFTQFILKHLDAAQNTIDIAELLADAAEAAHKNLTTPPIYNTENVLLLGGVCIRHAEDIATKTRKMYSLILMNVGSCRAYYWDYLKLQLLELTPDNLCYDTGCLGPSSSSDETPNIANLNIYSHLAEPHGMVLLMSPGVSAALDPYALGISSDEHDTCAEEMEETIRQFRNTKLMKLLSKAKHGDVGDHVNQILSYIRKLSSFDPSFEDEPIIPTTTLGHFSCVGFRVGPFQEDPPDNKQTRIETPKTKRASSASPRVPSKNLLPAILSDSGSVSGATPSNEGTEGASDRQSLTTSESTLENSKGRSRKGIHRKSTDGGDTRSSELKPKTPRDKKPKTPRDDSTRRTRKNESSDPSVTHGSAGGNDETN